MSLFNITLDNNGNLQLSSRATAQLPVPVIEPVVVPPAKPVKKFRIAVCLSGQPRHWQPSVENIKRFFEYDRPHPELGIEVETDYFIHTWDTNTWRRPKTDHSIYADEKHDDGAAIAAAYNPRAIKIDEFDRAKFPRAWDPMFYSFTNSLMLKRIYELENNFQYDIVVKARLDVVYNPALEFPINRVWPGHCYTCTPISKFPSEFNYYNFDDVCFWGNSATMDLVSDIYRTYKILHNPENIAENEAGKDLDPSMWYGPGCLIYQHLVNSAIHPDSRAFDYAVIRQTMVDAKLNTIYDYEQIRKKWFEWYI